MKKYVWSETVIEGGKPFHGALAQPPSVTGPFQTLAQQDPMGQMGGEGSKSPRIEDFYADSAVVGFREAAGERTIAELHPVVTTSSGAIEAAALSDGDLMSTVKVKIAPVGELSWIQFAFDQPETLQAVSFAFGGGARSARAVRW